MFDNHKSTKPFSSGGESAERWLSPNESVQVRRGQVEAGVYAVLQALPLMPARSFEPVVELPPSTQEAQVAMVNELAIRRAEELAREAVEHARESPDIASEPATEAPATTAADHGNDIERMRQAREDIKNAHREDDENRKAA